MSSKKDYKVTVAGTGLNFEQPVDMATASQIISLVMTGAVTLGGAPQPHQTAVAPPASEGAPPKTVSLASYIKAKKGESNQNVFAP